MASRLAAQLGSLNTSLLVDSSRRKSIESYLFTGREADEHDLESIHALGVNGFIQLRSLNPSLKTFEGSLFSDSVKDLDRTLLNAAANEELDRSPKSTKMFAYDSVVLSDIILPERQCHFPARSRTTFHCRSICTSINSHLILLHGEAVDPVLYDLS